MIDFRLCLVTDRSQSSSLDGTDEQAGHSSASAGPVRLDQTIDAACRSGVRVVQLREKDFDSRGLFDLACDLRRIASSYASKLLVNVRVDIVLASGCDGVHCPEVGFPPGAARMLLGAEALVGTSCHSLESIERASNDGADFVFYGPVFSTPSKTNFGPPVGLDALQDVCARCPIPVFAIGGITPERSIDCMEAGASGVAVTSAILASGDIPSSVHAFENALGKL